MKKSSFVSIFFLIVFSISSAPYFGGFFISNNTINADSFMTTNSLAFYFDTLINPHVRFYKRLSAGGSYDAIFTGRNGISGLAFLPLVELVFFEFNTSGSRDISYIKTNILTDDGKNFDFFKFRIGRIAVSSGLLFFNNYKADGVAIDFSIGNFSVNIFGVTNSFDYTPLLDFTGSGQKTVFTRWDLKRLPNLNELNTNKEDSGFISDRESPGYNFYLDPQNSPDYNSAEIAKYNSLRSINSLAGRIFSGVEFSLSRFFYQNISLYFTTNIDLIPDYLVLTHKSAILDVRNTFAGRYNSFYFGMRLDGRIITGLYYNFDIVYETGTNATYYNTGREIKYYNALINSFAINTHITYYFNSKLKPLVGLGFSYAHGDSDAVYSDRTVINKSGEDNGFKGITKHYTGFVLSPEFTNLLIISLRSGITPCAYIKNRYLSGFYLKNELLLLMRPVLNGSGIYSEKAEYSVVGADKYESNDKFYLGSEFNYTVGYQVFSDLGFEIQGGFLIPNSLISAENRVFWKVGFSINMSF